MVEKILRRITGSKIIDEQGRFMEGYACLYQVFTVRMIVENCMDNQKSNEHYLWTQKKA